MGLTQTPSTTLAADMTIDAVATNGSLVMHADSMEVGVDYNFPWTGAHHWTSGAAEIPITITAAAPQTANLLNIKANDGTDWVTVDKDGLVGLSDDPDAMLCIKARGIGDADILALSPVLWLDAADPNGDFTNTQPSDGTQVARWYDRTPHHNDAIPGANGTGGMWFWKSTGANNDKTTKPNSTTGAYMSPTKTSGGSGNAYGYTAITPTDVVVPSTGAGWTVIAVCCLPTGLGQDQVVTGGNTPDGIHAGFSRHFVKPDSCHRPWRIRTPHSSMLLGCWP